MILAVSCAKQITDPEPLTSKTNILKAGTTGTNYYVAKTGNDNNAGTSSSPFLTIQKAANIVNPGDSVIVRDGNYTSSAVEVLSITRSGTAASPIVFRSEHKWGAVLYKSSTVLTTESAISFNGSVSYVKVENFEIRNIVFWNIYIPAGCSHIEIRGNNIHDIGRICTDTDMGLVGMYLEGCSDIIVEGNIFHDIGRYASGENGCSTSTQYYMNHDHAIYIEGASRIRINNNIFYNNKSGWDIHMYSGTGLFSADVSILNNTFAFQNPNRDGFMVIFYATNTLIENNIFYSPRNVAVNLSGIGAGSTGTIRNNITYGAVASSVTPSGFTITNNLDKTDPKMVSPSTFDFSLQSTSPAINAGINVGLAYDFLRNSLVGLPDMGAYESGSSASTSSTYFNTLTSATAIKNSCGTGYTSPTVTYTVAAKKYSSIISQVDADAKATADLTANKQTYANTNGTCTSVTSTVYYNKQVSGTAVNNSCGTGYTGSTVTYIVLAKKYNSTVSQAAADNLATTDLNTNTQTYANANGSCTATSSVLPIGLTTVGGITEKGDNGFWIATSFTAGSNMTASKMNLYVGTASGKARLGIYTSVSGKPGTLLVQTGEIPLTNGWNSGLLGSSTNLIAGVTYWLSIEVSSSATTLYYNSAPGKQLYKSFTYNSFPSSAPLNCSSGTGLYSVYAN